MTTFVDTKTAWAITFHEVVLVFSDFLVPIFTINLKTYQHYFILGEKSATLQQKR